MFQWEAYLFNGDVLKEFNADGSENSFYMIDKAQLAEFHVVGFGNRFKYKTSTGVFFLNNHPIRFSFEDNNGVSYPISNQPMFYNDLIQFKKAHSDYSVKTGVAVAEIDSFNFGYKTGLQFRGVMFNFQVILTLPLKSAPYFQFKMNTDRDISGRFQIITGDKVYSYPAIFRANTSQQLEWVVN